jgi:hypothetical protein
LLGRRQRRGVLVLAHGDLDDASQSHGRLGVLESIEPRGTALPLHVHHREDEQAVALEGHVTSTPRRSTCHLRRRDRSPR